MPARAPAPEAEPRRGAWQDGRTRCVYRIAQEGVPLLLPHLTRQLINISAAEALRLVTEMSVPLPAELRIGAQVCTSCLAWPTSQTLGHSLLWIGAVVF